MQQASKIKFSDSLPLAMGCRTWSESGSDATWGLSSRVVEIVFLLVLLTSRSRMLIAAAGELDAEAATAV